MLRLTFSPVTSFYSDVEPFSKYSPVTLHLSYNTRILNENLEYAVFCSNVSFNLLFCRMQDAELVKASGYRSRSESAGFSGFSPEDDLVYKNKITVYRINITYSYSMLALTGFAQVIQNWKVMEFKNFIFQAWKVMECNCQSLKVRET